MHSSKIRQLFLDYFSAAGHQTVSSSPLVPTNDATLLFTNAGMVQFKDVFLGVDKRPYKRAVSIQKCIRAGGKHNDLDNVGYTARHHTFFEMLGNFSFGDYFKKEAIHFAWGFLTEVLKLPKEKLWVTVFRDDDEAASIWLNEIGIATDRLSRCDEKDNFWSMGDTGPCGPCSEIFFDHGPDIWGGPPGTADAEGDRYIEIWNLVFMQFNRNKAGELTALPQPSVDTGMGLERIAAVMQHVHNNYDIDGFQHIINALVKLIPETNLDNPSLKVIADHIRASGFLIAEGVVPSNEGRGYVLRRIIRRALRHGHKLNAQIGFFADLVESLAEIMNPSYPEIINQRAHIASIILQEEQQFARTLDQGMKLLQEALKPLSKGEQLTGAIAFKLFDTYGFPLDLTEDIVREYEISVDKAGFEQCMQQQRALSQASSQFQADYSNELKLEHCSTFSGYEQETASSSIIALIHDNRSVDRIEKYNVAGIILDSTPFYAESGGQVGDHGQLKTASGVFTVADTKRLGDAIIHYGTVSEGFLHLNDSVEALVDTNRRQAIRLNHTATHLLHAALKQLLGNHVNQKGSLVDAERARFDFSHPTALTAKELQSLENTVNEQIRYNHPVKTQLMSLDKARDSGAMALFGEKYADEVRVLTLGEFSKELCGGTHAKRTGDIGLFKILSEYGVASGVRRIEFVTGRYALDWVNSQVKLLEIAAGQLKTSPATLNDKLDQLINESKQKDREITQLKTNLAAHSSADVLADAESISGLTYLIKELKNQDMSALRTTLDQLRNKIQNGVIVLYTLHDNKINVVASVSKSLIPQVSAPMLVKELCGKGGGRDDMAQGGGLEPMDLAEKLMRVREIIKSIV